MLNKECNTFVKRMNNLQTRSRILGETERSEEYRVGLNTTHQGSVKYLLKLRTYLTWLLNILLPYSKNLIGYANKWKVKNEWVEIVGEKSCVVEKKMIDEMSRFFQTFAESWNKLQDEARRMKWEKQWAEGEPSWGWVPHAAKTRPEENVHVAGHQKRSGRIDLRWDRGPGPMADQVRTSFRQLELSLRKLYNVQTKRADCTCVSNLAVQLGKWSRQVFLICKWVECYIALNSSVGYGRISTYFISIDSPGKALHLVFWVQED